MRITGSNIWKTDYENKGSFRWLRILDIYVFQIAHASEAFQLKIDINMFISSGRLPNKEIQN